MPPGLYRTPALVCPTTGSGGGLGTPITADATFPATLAVGDVVAIVGDRVANVYTVDKADPRQLATLMPAVGVLTAKTTTTTGTITLLGPVSGLSGLTPGDPLWVSISGTIISGSNASITPAVEGNRVGLQSVGTALASDVALFIPQVPNVRRYTP